MGDGSPRYVVFPSPCVLESAKGEDMTALKWEHTSEWCIESNKGNYVVTKYLQDGKPIYQAIKRPGTSLLVAGNSKLCRAACDADFETNNKGEM